MHKTLKLLLLLVTVFLLASSVQVECRRTYSSRSSSSGRGNRGKNQPSGGGIFSSWFGGSKSSGSGSGSISKPAPTSAKKNWQTASGHATTQSKSGSNWANPYYKPSGSAPVPSAPKEPNYGWKPAANSNAKPANAYPSSNIGSRGYPVQGGVQQGSQGSFSGLPGSNYQPAQNNFGGYRPASNVPSTHNTAFHPSGPQNNYGGYHSAPNYHQSSGYHASGGAPHQSNYHPAGGHYSGAYPQQPGGFAGGYHPSYSGNSAHTGFGGTLPSYQGTKLFGSNAGHYGYPGSGGGWGIDTYGGKKSSGTGKLLTGLAIGGAGGYLTSSLINSISNPWKYSGGGYGSRYGYGSGYDNVRSRDESAFERGFERGVQVRQNENNNSNNNNKETVVPPPPEDSTSKWVQCVAFDPQTQQTLINPNCSCTVTTSLDERTGQPLSVHHCTTLNGLVMRPVPAQPPPGVNLPPPPLGAQPFGGVDGQPIGGVNAQGAVPSFGAAYEGNFQYGGGPTVYLPPQTETKVEKNAAETKPESTSREAVTDKSSTETKAEQSTTEAKSEHSTIETKTENASGIVKEREIAATEKDAKLKSVVGGSEALPISEGLGGDFQGNQKRTAEFYGQLQKIVNMGNFVDGG